MWKDVTTPSKVKAVIIDQNKRHLQQIDIEGGENRGPIMTELREGHGVSEATSRLLDGTYSTTHTVSPAMAAWFDEMKQSKKEKGRPPIVGCMSKDGLQFSFNQVKEKTTSSPSGMHYTIWKALAKSNWCAEFMCIMISLPFMFGFACNR